MSGIPKQATSQGSQGQQATPQVSPQQLAMMRGIGGSAGIPALQAMQRAPMGAPPAGMAMPGQPPMGAPGAPPGMPPGAGQMGQGMDPQMLAQLKQMYPQMFGGAGQ